MSYANAKYHFYRNGSYSLCGYTTPTFPAALRVTLGRRESDTQWRCFHTHVRPTSLPIPLILQLGVF
jgi:hypothetical protein